MERVALSGLSLAGRPSLPTQAQPLCLQVETLQVTDVQALTLHETSKGEAPQKDCIYPHVLLCESSLRITGPLFLQG